MEKKFWDKLRQWDGNPTILLQTEFVVDFIKLMPASPKAKVKSRIILTPQNAKRLFKALAENISKYESTHGPIKDVNEKLPPFTMGGPAAQA